MLSKIARYANRKLLRPIIEPAAEALRERRAASDIAAFPRDAILQANSTEELQAIAAHHRLHGFNGQVIRTAYLAWLYRTLGCTSFLETGTRIGHTAVTAKKLFGCPVYSVELLPENHARASLLARRAIGPNHDLQLVLSDSRVALRQWLKSDQIGARPMVYLDAHNFDDHPLTAEIHLVLDRGSAVIVIDDFAVPMDAGFGWDRKNGVDVNLYLVTPVLPPERSQIAIPAYSSWSETGAKRGSCVITIDIPLPGSGTFPGNLFETFDRTTFG